MPSLVEVDELEAVVIMDNEIDCMTWIAPDTVDVTGRFPDLCLNKSVDQEVEGTNVKVLPMESGMLKAVDMINQAKAATGSFSTLVVVDLHPDRPQLRGFNIKAPVALPAGPTFNEIRAAGGAISESSGAHTVLDNKFLISGFIPASAPYETGLKGGIAINNPAKGWEKDEEMADERFLMCNLKGKGIVMFTGCSHRGVVNASRSAVEQLGGSVPLHAVLGGYHLVASAQAQVEETVKDLKELDPKVMLPGHCSGWRVKYEIEKQMPGRLVPCTVGSKIKF
ncbi:beta-lactamase domain-containing protein [Halenospora varia]|nr:beta-lactamase domain-containing protein [Halenospora varia]